MPVRRDNHLARLISSLCFGAVLGVLIVGPALMG